MKPEDNKEKKEEILEEIEEQKEQSEITDEENEEQESSENIEEDSEPEQTIEDIVGKTSPFQLTVSIAGKELKQSAFDKDEISMGRDPKCDLIIDNLGASRVHAKIFRVGRFFILKDMGSKTGTFIRGKKIDEYFLNEGDEIFLAKHSITFGKVSSLRWHQDKEKNKRGMKMPSSVSKGLMRTMQVDFRNMAKKQGPPPAYFFMIKNNRKIPMMKNVFLFGKAKNCDITATGFLIGEKHALIVKEEKGFFLHNLGLFRPPKVNEKPIDFAMLQDGDLVQIGDLNFIFQIPQTQRKENEQKNENECKNIFKKRKDKTHASSPPLGVF